MADLTEYPTPRSRQNPEPPPTCPFINQQCQRTRQLKPDNQPSPNFRARDLVSVYVGDRSKREPVALTASVEWHLGPSSESVNRKKRACAFFFFWGAESRRNPGFFDELQRQLPRISAGTPPPADPVPIATFW